MILIKKFIESLTNKLNKIILKDKSQNMAICECNAKLFVSIIFKFTDKSKPNKVFIFALENYLSQ